MLQCVRSFASFSLLASGILNVHYKLIVDFESYNFAILYANNFSRSDFVSRNPPFVNFARVLGCSSLCVKQKSKATYLMNWLMKSELANLYEA